MTNSQPPGPEIDWIPLGKMTVYHVTEQELEEIEQGSPESIFLTFCIFCLSIGITTFLSLLLLDPKKPWVFVVYVVVTVVFLLAGAVLFFLWRHHKKSTRRVIQKIRARKRPVGEQVPGSPLSPAKVIAEPGK